MAGSDAPRALGAGSVPPKRALFGLLDAAGWGWAFFRAVLWTLVIILLLGYVPDRAYYLTVSPTVELGLNIVSPVNICPAENEGLPCPAPVGALVPWKDGATTSLPGGGEGGALLQAGSHVYYLGGFAAGALDEFATTAAVTTAEITAEGLGDWSAAAPLPEPRAHAAVAYLAGKAYVIGGTSATEVATSTVYVGTPDAASGLIASWSSVDAIKLPEARTGAAVVAVSDGLLLVGGEDAAHVPQATVWKATLGESGELGAWTEFMALPSPRAAAAAALVGDALYVWGGRDASGPTGVALRGDIAVAKSPATGHSTTPAVDNGQGDAEIGTIFRWTATEAAASLPQPRDGAALWSANGTLYVAGGTVDGAVTTDVSWAAPTAIGGIAGWTSVDQSDLPGDAARVGAVGTVVGGQALLIGGRDAAGDPTATTLVAGTSPKAPVFRLGLFGLTVPGLAIPGEVGQQLGYLAAAGVWTLHFVLLLAAAVAYAQRERFGAWVRRLAGRKGPRS